MSNDNRMYVMGGTADTPPAFDFNFFDATALAWSGQFFATGAVPESRFQHTAVLIGDCIYIYGGRYDSTTYAHMYCFNIQ
ncbi:tea3, partial [Symbiodinium pilosum]